MKARTHGEDRVAEQTGGRSPLRSGILAEALHLSTRLCGCNSSPFSDFTPLPPFAKPHCFTYD